MKKNKQEKTIIYNKLIRDKIPEIIRKSGKTSVWHKIEGDELKNAIGQKFLEEFFELFNEWQQGNRDGILNEAADVLEIILTGLKHYNLTIEDLFSKRKAKAEKRGGFNDHLFLEQVGGAGFLNIPELLSPSVIFNPVQKKKLLKIIRTEITISSEVRIASAFYSPGQSNLLISELSSFVERGGYLKTIFSTMGNFTRPEYFKHFKKFVPDSNLKIFHPHNIPYEQAPPDFHVKTWLFRHQDGKGSILIGSSNFTHAGILKNFEWNFFSSGEVNLPFNNQISPYASAVTEFDKLWEEESVPLSDKFLNAYQKRFNQDSSWKIIKDKNNEIFETRTLWGEQKKHDASLALKPNEAQKQALNNLKIFREQNINKAAVVAATGIGKTHIAAFDFSQTGYKKLLFIAHREVILSDARKIFQDVMTDSDFGEIYGAGSMVSKNCSAVFAMVQTLSRSNHISRFTPSYFDYIVIDEFHHMEADSYKKILDYFKPSFLLGLTATPERMDGRDVLALCDHNVAYEIRLLEAVERGWLTPFQYFAIYDETDYEQVTWTGTGYNEQELENVLKNDTRTEIIARNLQKYLPSKGKIKALAFCSSVSHAEYTAKKLTDDFNIPSVSLCGDSPDQKRKNIIKRLQDEADKLNVVCTVDIFNEGIDIPCISHVIFLRPTQSFTVFIQQLGRGLRKSSGKDFLVVLDFVGNFRKAHVVPLALCGYTNSNDCITDKPGQLIQTLNRRLPEACYLNVDVEVQRLWSKELKKILQKGKTLAERLKDQYWLIKKQLGKQESLNLMNISNAHEIDPQLYLKPEPFGSWLRAQIYCESKNLDKRLSNLIDTPGEYLLKHVETGLNPAKSYKMVVLLNLLELGGCKWKIPDIAEKFLLWYLDHKDYISDYDALAKVENPEHYKISSVVSHIKRMPLHRLSNTDSDCFVLDKKHNIFMIKKEYKKYWRDSFFRIQVKDRIRYVLTRYFNNF